MRLARFAAVASAMLFIGLASTASAAVRPVDIVNFTFSPASVTITIGDTVTWTNKDAAAHSARVPGVGTTRVLTQGQSASLMFNAAGSFPYDCGVHGPSMSGTVVVRAAATQPPPPPPPTPPPPTPPPPTAPVPVKQVQLEGEISNLSGACPSWRFRLEGQDVYTINTTDYSRGSCTAMRNGTDIEVTGWLMSDNTVRADRIRYEDD
jgi:plastocyanin